MRRTAAAVIVALAPGVAAAAVAVPLHEGLTGGVLFATYAADTTQLRHAVYLAESVRAFGGGLRDARIWVYAPSGVLDAQPGLRGQLAAARAEARPATAPEEVLRFPFAGKVFAAAQAERDATGAAEILAWLDEDTVVLAEPDDFRLPDGVSLG